MENQVSVICVWGHSSPVITCMHATLKQKRHIYSSTAFIWYVHVVRVCLTVIELCVMKRTKSKFSCLFFSSFAWAGELLRRGLSYSKHICLFVASPFYSLFTAWICLTVYEICVLVMCVYAHTVSTGVCVCRCWCNRHYQTPSYLTTLKPNQIYQLKILTMLFLPNCMWVQVFAYFAAGKTEI